MKRRVFLGTLAGAAALNRVALARQPEPLKVGLIGCGWYGLVVLKAAFEAGGVETVALCDVDSERLSKAAEEVSGLQSGRPRTYAGWQDLLDHEGLQVVIIGTPPHWHALQFIAACERGLDVYCEKPLSYDVREGRAMVDAWRKAGNVVQVGFQRRQSAAIRQAGEYMAEGKAGRILSAAAQIHYSPGLADPTPTDPPASLDWEQWCGPAPKLPYSAQIGHFNWRLEKAYGNGHLVDWGIHWIDSIRTNLGLGMPRSITSAGGLYALKGRITTPDVLTAHFEFEELPVVWTHRLHGAAEYSPETSIGMFFYGEKETLFLSDNRYVVVPNAKDAERRVVEVSGNAQLAHVSEFLDAVRTRGEVGCTPEDAFQSTASVQLAMVALDAGGRLDWDADSEQVHGNSRAASLLKRDYRGPWTHPFTA